MRIPDRKIMNFSLLKQHSFQQLSHRSPDVFDTPVMKGEWLRSEFEFLKSHNLVSDSDSEKFIRVGPRRGSLDFVEVVVETPAFMPVGTAGVVKSLESQDVSKIGFPLILGNTYHLFLRPGLDVLQSFGGLHSFMRWPGVILTDSGGFQVMSLAKIRKLSEEGVEFANHING